MKLAGSLAALALVAGLGACSHNGSQSAGAASAQAQEGMGPTCPVAQVPGVRASLVSARDGVAITFTAPQSEVEQLRQEVGAMADANDRQGTPFAACPCAFSTSGSAEAMPDGPNAEGNRWTGRSATGPAMASETTTVLADAHVESISTGAVLHLRAKDKDQVDALRSEVRAEIRSMQENGCLSRR